MNKIRINVLARELEVKAHELLDKLPELGVTEKKTHPSSIGDDVAEKVRHIFGHGGTGERAEQPSSNGASTAAVEEPDASQAQPERSQPEVSETPREAQPEGQGISAEEKFEPRVAPQQQRLRPPLATSGASPITPPAPAPTAGTTIPGAPIRPVPPPPRPIPATPKPGQILSGPRQPLPGGMAPQQPVRVSSGPAPAYSARSAAPTTAQSPGAPAPPPPTALRTTPSRPGLAGQPAVRPIVPPRPDLAAKLSQPRPVGPGAPVAPRPGVPMRQQGAPTPGQPIYRGPIRPGQPLMARQGQGVRPGGPPGVRPGGPRPMHPT